MTNLVTQLLKELRNHIDTVCAHAPSAAEESCSLLHRLHERYTQLQSVAHFSNLSILPFILMWSCLGLAVGYTIRGEYNQYLARHANTQTEENEKDQEAFGLRHTTPIPEEEKTSTSSDSTTSSEDTESEPSSSEVEEDEEEAKLVGMKLRSDEL